MVGDIVWRLKNEDRFESKSKTSRPKIPMKVAELCQKTVTPNAIDGIMWFVLGRRSWKEMIFYNLGLDLT